MSFAFNKFKDDKLSRNQKRNLRGALRKKPKPKAPKILAGSQERFWCPVKKEGYWGSNRRTHCKLCYKDGVDKHEMIKFDKSKGHIF